MGEWSEYFEDFPEENPANWANGKFDPSAAANQRFIEESNRQVAKESQSFQRKMFEMAAAAKRNASERASKINNQTKEDETP